jgi:phosphate transport system ATP-binding protein
VVVTHNIQQAARISQQVAFLSQGHLIEVGRTARVFTNPRREETQTYLTGRAT